MKRWILLPVEGLESRLLMHAAAPVTIAATDHGGLDKASPMRAASTSIVTPATHSKGAARAAVATVTQQAEYNGTIGGDGTGEPVPSNDAITYSALADGLPVLNSDPNAGFKLFLDFDGFTGTGYGGTRNDLPLSLDSDTTTFNAAEQALIVKTWQQIATFYAPFDVNVTTTQPTTSDTFSWVVCGNTGGGYSYVKIYSLADSDTSNNLYAPSAFVSTSDVQTRITGVIHESGHNWGLQHQSTYNADGTLNREYAYATDPLHGPVMGVDFDGTVSTWLDGYTLNKGPTVLQDDIATILKDIKIVDGTSATGYRPDDYGNTAATATTVAVGSTTHGIIESTADVDAFKFTSTGGSYDLSAAREGISGVDLKLEVYNSAGNIVAASDSDDNNQALRLNLATGDYTVLVKSHGNYSDIGQYLLNVSTANVLHHWAFDEGSGTTATDTGNGGAAGTINGATYTTASKVGSSALSFDGVSNTVTFPTTAALSGVTDFNVSAYVKTTDTTGGVIIQQRDVNGFNGEYMLSLTSAGKVEFMIYGGNAYQFDFTTTKAVNDNAWHRITAERVGLVGHIYIDGVLAATATGTAIAPLVSTITVAVGGDIRGSNNYLSGTIDDVQIDNRAVAAATATTYTGLTASTLTATRGGVNTATSLPQINLSWSAVAGAAGYTILQSDDGAIYKTLATVASTVASYVTDVAEGVHRYFFEVVANKSDGTGGSISNAANALSVPQAVKNGRVMMINGTSVNVDWIGGDTNGETAVTIEKSTDGVTYTALTTLAANVPCYYVTGLTAATKYWFRVTPFDGTTAGVPTIIVGATAGYQAVTGFKFTSLAPTAVSMSWTDQTGKTGYTIERSLDNITWLPIATPAANATTYTDSTVTAFTEYHYRVIANYGGFNGDPGTTIFAATPAVTPALPTSYTTADIGAVGGSGATAYTSSTGTFTQQASGTDLYGAADSFRFTYVPLAGDMTVIARVASVEATNTVARAGVMIRQSLTASSANVSTSITSGSGFEFARRLTDGGVTTRSTRTTGIAAPYWVKLVRVGNVFTSYSSPDGVTWTSRGSATVAMTGTVYAGIENTAGDNTLLSTAAVDNVSIVSNDTVAPTVVTSQINDGSVQRSLVRSLTVTFSEPVTLAANAISVRKTGATADVTSAIANPSADGKTYVVTFSGTGVTSGSLDDGRYTLTVNASLVKDLAANAMAANYTSAFFRLFGDADGDAGVSINDFNALASAFGTTSGNAAYNAAFDYDADNGISINDFNAFASRFGTTV